MTENPLRAAFAAKTPWYPMHSKPIRKGEYKGREKRTGLWLVIHWRQLTDERKAGWYFAKGRFGPFNLWESAEGKITAWCGLAVKP